MADQQPIPDGDELAETIDRREMELILVDDDGDDADDTQLSDSLPASDEKPREEVVWVSEAAAKTVIVNSEAEAEDTVSFLLGLLAQFAELQAGPKETYFDGFGLSDDELLYAISLVGSSDREDLGEFAKYLRDVQILRLQRKWVGIELNPLADRDTSGRPKFTKGDFGGLSAYQRESLLGFFAKIFRMDEMPAYALDLMLRDSAFPLDVCEFFAERMDTFRCTSRPYVVPDYGLQPIQLLRQNGCTLNIQHSVLRNIPRAHTAPKADARILFFQMARNASPLEVEERYRQLGLRPLDFWELCAFNLKYPSFLVSQPNATHWVVEGDWRFAAFYTHDRDVIRRVALKRPSDKDGFIRGWHFAGVPIVD